MKNKSKENIRNLSNNLRLDFKDKEVKLNNYRDKREDVKDYVDKRINEKDRFLDKRKEQKFNLTKNDSENENIKRTKSNKKSIKQIDTNESNEVKTVIHQTYSERGANNINSLKLNQSKEQHSEFSLSQRKDFKHKKIKKSVTNFHKPSSKREDEVAILSADINEVPLDNSHEKKDNLYKLKSKQEYKNDEVTNADNLDSARSKKRRNYHLNEIFTRDKIKKDSINLVKSDNLKDKVLDKAIRKLKSSKQYKIYSNRFIKERKTLGREKKQLNHKKIKKKDGLNRKLSKSSLLLANYLENGSDENTGVKASEKSLRAYSRVMQKGKRYRNTSIKRLKNQDDKTIIKKGQREKARLVKNKYLNAIKELNKSSEYQKKSALKKFLKRKQMKKAIYNKENLNTVNRIKKATINTLKGSLKVIQGKIKSMAAVFIGFLIILMVILNLASSILGIFNATSTSILTTSYLSDEDELESVNQEYSSLEYNLQDEINNVRNRYPNYDEYIINADEIGHDTHTLLAYLTSRYGVFEEDGNMNSHLLELFNEIYDLKYESEVEIRYKTEYYSYTDSSGTVHSGSYEVPYEYKKLVATLTKKDMDSVVRNNLSGNNNNLWHYETLLKTHGNMDNYFGSGSSNSSLSEIVNNDAFKNPGIAFNDRETKELFNEAEKHIGKRYVFGANGPTNFDCSSFVCYTFTHSGIKNMPRTTAWGIYKSYCNPISKNEAKAGDIIFFKNTYNSGSPISHVGIYAGNGMMIHAGDPIKYSSINTPYWREHFYGFGRVK